MYHYNLKYFSIQFAAIFFVECSQLERMADTANKVQRSTSQCAAGVYHLGHLWVKSDDSCWWCNNISIWQTRVSYYVFIPNDIFSYIVSYRLYPYSRYKPTALKSTLLWHSRISHFMCVSSLCPMLTKSWEIWNLMFSARVYFGLSSSSSSSSMEIRKQAEYLYFRPK